MYEKPRNPRKASTKPEPARPNRCVLVADEARARLFAIDEGPEQNGSPLHELADLVNPEASLERRDLFSDTRSGRMSRSGGGAHSADRRIERHEVEYARRFAKSVAREVGESLRERRAGQLVVIAPPKFLGHLRPHMKEELPARTATVEVGSDLTWHTLERIGKSLRKAGLLRPLAAPAVTYRARARQPKRGGAPLRSRRA